MKEGAAIQYGYWQVSNSRLSFFPTQTYFFFCAAVSINFVMKSVPRHIEVARDVFARTKKVKLIDISSSDLVERFFSMLRSGGGSFARNPSSRVVDARTDKIRFRTYRKMKKAN
jgi:hypothetical protein